MPKLSQREIEVLKKSTILKGIDPNAVASILGEAQWTGTAKGDTLFQQGEAAIRLFILLQGKIKLSQVNSEGNQVLLRILGPGEVIAGVSAFENTVYPATATALEKCAALSFDRPHLLRLMERHPQISLNVNRILLGRMQELQDRFRELATERVEKRVACALIRLARANGRKTPEGILIDLPLSRQDLAELTGTTLYTVSRLLKAWEGKGILKSERKRITLIQPRELASVAGEMPQALP
ncbi:MAG: Crp/Fnr family transcriptional regulator [bacterium]